DQALDLGGDAALALLDRGRPSAADVEVEVDPVLHRLPLRHLLEVDARAPAFGVDDRARPVPLGFGDAFGLEEGLPAVEARWRGLQRVAERLGPELCQPVRIVAVEDD